MTRPPRDFTARRADDAEFLAAETAYNLATAALRHRMQAARLARRVRRVLYYATLFAFTVAALVMLDLRLTDNASVFGAAISAALLWFAAWGVWQLSRF